MKYDIAIIGSGPAGYVGAIRASQLGFKVVVIEKGELGGICLNWGCIPTKSLLKSAEVANTARSAKNYGIMIDGEIQPDFPKVIARSRRIASQMSKGIEMLFKKNNIDVVKGKASFIDNNSLSIETDGENQKVEADKIIIATGARSAELPSLPQDRKKVIGYKEALALETLPESMIVVGSGAIGVELAFFYASMGTKVTILEYMPQIIPREDAEVAAQLERGLKKTKIKIFADTKITDVDTNGDICKIKATTPKGEKEFESELILSAVGVTSNIENIGFENIGGETEKGKIKVDSLYQTNIEGIYAIGDVIATPALAHVASAEAIACVEAIAGEENQPIDYNSIPSCIYTTPEVSSVGMSEAAALEKGYKVKVGNFPFSALGKATAIGERDGFVKLVFNAQDNTLLGASMVGAYVTEMIAELVVSQKLNADAVSILKSIHPHPSMSEAIMEAAAAALGEAIHI